MTYYLTFVTLTLVTWPWALRPDAPLLNTNIPCKFRENRMMGKGRKGCDGQTDGRLDGRLDMIWLLHKVLTWFQAWKSHVAGWLLQRRLYPLFQCCGVDLLDIHLHTARARVTIIKFLIPLVFPIQFQPLPDEETVDRSHYIIKYCNLHQTRILEYK